MLELLARIDVLAAGYVAFLTLTYPDREGPPSASQTEHDRQVFLKRIRRAHPDASAIWRREWEPRKSGNFGSVVFPHYHFLFFGLPFLPHQDLNAIWGGVLGWKEYIRTEIKGLHSWRQALHYVAKYMGKIVADARPFPGDDAAGKAEPPGDGHGGEAASSLVYGTYLTGENEGRKSNKASIGRSWGVFNRKRLPMAGRTVHRLDGSNWLEQARHLARKQWPGLPDYPGCGFSLFVDNPDEWVGCVLALGDLFEFGVLPDEESVLRPVRRGAPC